MDHLGNQPISLASDTSLQETDGNPPNDQIFMTPTIESILPDTDGNPHPNGLVSSPGRKSSPLVNDDSPPNDLTSPPARDSNPKENDENHPNDLASSLVREPNPREKYENCPSEQPSIHAVKSNLQEMEGNSPNYEKIARSLSVKRNTLQSILFLPQPLESTAKNKRTRDNFPGAISSKAWRMKLAMKEEEKTLKEEEAKRKL